MDVTTTAGTRSTRVGTWMGIVFVILFSVGFSVFSTPNGDANAGKWQRWWLDSGHRTAAVVGAYLMVLGLLAFLCFVATLRRRLGAGGGLAVVFGSVFVALGLVSALVRAAIPGGKVFGSTPVPAGADFARQFDNIGFALLLVAGALAAGAFVITTSYLARQSGLLPGWLTIAGFVVGVLQLAGGVFFPFLIFLIWMLVTSIVLLRQIRIASGAHPNATSG
jgi:hypothetical protein